MRFLTRTPTPRRSGPAFQHSLQHAVLGELDRRGQRSARAPMHRSIWGLQLPRRRLLRSTALALVLTLVLLALREAIAQAWAGQLVWWLGQLGLEGRWSAQIEPGQMPWHMGAPRVSLAVSAPQELTLAGNTLGVLLLWWVVGRLPDAARPAAYLLRLCAIIQGTAVFFFWLWPASFPHSVDDHIANGLQQCWALMLLAPWIHLGTYYLFAVSWAQRLAVTLLTWGWLLLLAPLLYALHALVIARFGVLAMPLLHLLLGVMVAIIGFVAIYGWAMSWANQRTLRQQGA